jgi:preprotein translocase subunit SecE
MAKAKKPKFPRIGKKPETVRERADKNLNPKQKHTNKLKGKLGRPVTAIKKVGQKEYNPISVPKNKAGRVLGKRFNLVPTFFKKSWAELKLVTWPTKKNAAKMTMAVVVFAVVFALFVQILDFIFNKLFKVILLK